MLCWGWEFTVNHSQDEEIKKLVQTGKKEVQSRLVLKEAGKGEMPIDYIYLGKF